MQTQSRILDDMAKVAAGAVSAATGLKTEVEQVIRQRFDAFAEKMDLVTREEFEAVKAMAAQARAEQEVLSARLKKLEDRLDAVED